MTTKRKWPSPGELADALESGEWSEGKGYLMEPKLLTVSRLDAQGSYCCLGVSARLAGYTDDQLSDCKCLLHEDIGDPALGDGPDWMNHAVELELVELNDNVGWGEVIPFLRNLDDHLAGRST